VSKKVIDDDFTNGASGSSGVKPGSATGGHDVDDHLEAHEIKPLELEAMRPKKKKGKKKALHTDTTIIIPTPLPPSGLGYREVIPLLKPEYLQIAGVEGVNKGTGAQLTQFMVDVSQRKECANKPLFVSMARVQSSLYWQLIENYFHTMNRFGHVECSILVCISDIECAQLCEKEGFPCFPYNYYSDFNLIDPFPVGEDTFPEGSKEIHVMEQIACLKLKYIGDALEKGVNIIILDLDVGFLRDPLLLYDGFLADPLEQVRSQMDVGYSQHRTQHYWYTHPRPNFGLFIVKADTWSIKLFQRAWRLYMESTEEKRMKVATDQNYMANAIKWARWRMGFNFSYFDLGYNLDQEPRPVLRNQKALLLDKVKEQSKNGIKFEMGGDMAKEELTDAIAVHATCYEGQTKLLALRAANAFYTPHYYDPNRRTLTKPIMFVSPESMYREIAALAFLAIRSNRTLIIPNILVGVGNPDEVLGQPLEIACGDALGGRARKDNSKDLRFDESSMDSSEGDGVVVSTPVIDPSSGKTVEITEVVKLGVDRSFFCQEVSRRMVFSSYRLLRQKVKHTAGRGKDWYWPAFRVVSNYHDGLEIVEPAYYSRCAEENKNKGGKGNSYGQGKGEIPEPYILSLDVGVRPGHPGMQRGANDILDAILDADPYTRVVLDLTDSRFDGSGYPGGVEGLKRWTATSDSVWEPHKEGFVDKSKYVAMPPLSTLMTKLSLDLEDIGKDSAHDELSHNIFSDVKLCKNFMKPVMGNRTCFATCK